MCLFALAVQFTGVHAIQAPPGPDNADFSVVVSLLVVLRNSGALTDAGDKARAQKMKTIMTRAQVRIVLPHSG